MAGAAKEIVKEFWEAKPCGSTHTSSAEGTPEYFAEVERSRYELEPFIPRYARFAETTGQNVLEIGVGLGTDFLQFARAGAEVTGVDLTQHAVDLVARRLALEGLSGDVAVADAERLPFADGSFDVVYSWGVLHHTPDTERAMREALRVLRPGGRLCLMVYARHSWVAYGLWARYALLRGRPWHSLATRGRRAHGERGYPRVHPARAAARLCRSRRFRRRARGDAVRPARGRPARRGDRSRARVVPGRHRPGANSGRMSASMRCAAASHDSARTRSRRRVRAASSSAPSARATASGHEPPGATSSTASP